MNKGRKRAIHIQFYLNEKEFDTLNERVAKSGMSREGYLRHLVNGIIPIERPSKELLEYIKELRQIGNNINQIAMKANSSNIVDRLQYKKDFEWLQDVISRASSGSVKWQ